MNTKTTNGLLRPIAFFMVGVLLICTFGFTVDGWQTNYNAIADSQYSDTLQNNNDIAVVLPDEDLPKIPDFINYITGLETTEELSKAKPISVLMNSNNANYGISKSDVLCEIPIEDGTTRFLSIISDTTDLWKIGSIANGRGYISNISKFFGATMICDKNEDIISYDQCDISKEIVDINNHTGSFYTEYDVYKFSNIDMLSEILPTAVSSQKSPYVFNEFGNEPILGDTKSINICITYSHISKTELSYDEQTATYTLMKNGVNKTDALNGKTIGFVNCFILFADSATYDNASGTRLVMNTIGNGDGYYFTNGTMLKIRWSSDINGNYCFTDTAGNVLSINRGPSYIGYVKSSAIESVSF